jgi:hypothetical protein
MNWIFLLVIAAAVIVFMLVKLKGRQGNEVEEQAAKGTFTGRTIATKNEQAMFWRLVQVFPMPEYIVLTQVSFGAMLNAKGGASRYSFSQKRADFVLLDRAFSVLAVIELDDASHDGQEERDRKRDEMLIEAGYRVLRYRGIPQPEKLRSDIPPGDKRQH